jgi:putative acetyltransferase
MLTDYPMVVDVAVRWGDQDALGHVTNTAGSPSSSGSPGLSVLGAVRVRPESPGDVAAIRRVNELAFEGTAEADLIDALRSAGAVTLSMVAVVGDEPAIGGETADGEATTGGEVIAHALVSPVTIMTDHAQLPALGLGPVGVRPDLQGRGVGTMLIEACLEHARAAGHTAVVVVGHPGYYPRFGFLPASRWGLFWEEDVPDEAFMALELRPGALAGISGIVRCRPEFTGV